MFGFKNDELKQCITKVFWEYVDSKWIFKHEGKWMN